MKCLLQYATYRNIYPLWVAVELPKLSKCIEFCNLSDFRRATFAAVIISTIVLGFTW